MNGEMVMLSARVPKELRELVNTDPRDNQEVIQSALQLEYGGTAKAAIQRRIEEKERRISNLESEKNERERELAKERDEKERLEKKLNNFIQSRQDKLEKAKEVCESVEWVPDNPAIKNHANKLGITPEMLIEELEEMN